jgi:hypothetical protein
LQHVELEPDIRLLPPLGALLCSRPRSCTPQCRTPADELATASIFAPSICSTFARKQGHAMSIPGAPALQCRITCVVPTFPTCQPT